MSQRQVHSTVSKLPTRTDVALNCGAVPRPSQKKPTCLRNGASPKARHSKRQSKTQGPPCTCAQPEAALGPALAAVRYVPAAALLSRALAVSKAWFLCSRNCLTSSLLSAAPGDDSACTATACTSAKRASAFCIAAAS